jgi:hypothetical protein
MLFGLNRNAPIDPAAVAAAHGRLQTRLEQDPRLPSLQPGALTLAGLDAPKPQAAGNGQPMTAQQPAEPFQWGQGGTRLSPDDIAARSRFAQQQIAGGMDFSPVQSWTQGAARAAQALVGSRDLNRLDKAAQQNMTAEQQILQSLAGTGAKGGAGNGPALIAAIGNRNLSKPTRDALELQYQAQNRAPAQPHYFEANNGDQYAIGPDGKPQKLFADPTPKMNFITDGMGGGDWFAVPMTGAGGYAPPPTGASPAVPTAPVGRITPIGGGAPSQGARNFP